MILNTHSTADEYLFSLQPKNNTEGQHYVCVTFKSNGEPDIVRVTKHNRKDWIVLNCDILCLHRWVYHLLYLLNTGKSLRGPGNFMAFASCNYFVT